MDWAGEEQMRALGYEINVAFEGRQRSVRKMKREVSV